MVVVLVPGHDDRGAIEQLTESCHCVSSHPREQEGVVQVGGEGGAEQGGQKGAAGVWYREQGTL